MVRAGEPGARFLALGLGGCGVALALATGGPTDADVALGALSNAASAGLVTTWAVHPAPAVALVLLAAVLATTAAAQEGKRARQNATLAGLVLALAGPVVSTLLITRAGWGMADRKFGTALGLAASAALLHGAAFAPMPEDVRVGLRRARELTILSAGALVCLFLTSDARHALGLLGVALAIVAAVSIHAVVAEERALHVYFVEIAIVLAYGLVRSQRVFELPDEADAVCALGFGFLLAGVTALARRARYTPVELATRRFAALLPLAVALLAPRLASTTGSALVGASSLLYAALATVAGSRWFGALGALACNAALLLLALAKGATGLEVYLAPLGLFLLMLGHLFRRDLGAGRRLVDVGGSLLVYAPVAVELVSRLARAEGGGYAVGFGVACLVGLGASLFFRIRVYFLLAAGFLCLDVVANLVYAGLRDHRVGFLLLSLAGLLILGGMIFATLHRERLRRAMERARRWLRGLD